MAGVVAAVALALFSSAAPAAAAIEPGDFPPPTIGGLTALKSFVQVPGSVELSLHVTDSDEDPDYWYQIRIVREGLAGTPYSYDVDYAGTCDSEQTYTCQINDPYELDYLAPFAVRRYHAEVIQSGSHRLISETASVGVSVHPPAVPVELKVEESSLGTGYQQITATTNIELDWIPYYIVLRNNRGEWLGQCGRGHECSFNKWAEAGYVATVETNDGSVVIGRSSVGGLSVAQVAAMYSVGGTAGTVGICDAIAFAPIRGLINRSSINEASLACTAAAATGASVAALTAIAMEYGGQGLLAWLASQGRYTPAGVWVSDPWPTDAPPQPEPPAVRPEIWDQPVIETAETLERLNAEKIAELELTTTMVRTIAFRCLWLAAQVGLGVDECSKEGLPIFVTGGDNLEASQHDLEALATPAGPSWVKLNYENKTRTRWYDGDSRCEGMTGVESGNDCDEFPFASTEQGGKFGELRTGFMPSLKPVPLSPNRSQGGFLVGFITKCMMKTGVVQPNQTSLGGDPYLVIPIPVPGIPTAPFCNGKTG